MPEQMVALKQFAYGTRRLEAGDIFEATDNHTLLLHLGLAKPAPDAGQYSELEAARLRYQAVFGKPCDGRWGSARIEKELKQSGAKL